HDRGASRPHVVRLWRGQCVHVLRPMRARVAAAVARFSRTRHEGARLRRGARNNGRRHASLRAASRHRLQHRAVSQRLRLQRQLTLSPFQLLKLDFLNSQLELSPAFPPKLDFSNLDCLSSWCLRFDFLFDCLSNTRLTSARISYWQFSTIDV